MTDNIILDVDDLTEAIPALTNALAQYMKQAIVMCMSEHQHDTGVPCEIWNLEELLSDAEIVWAEPYTSRLERLFGSASNAAELAGEGIAFLTILAMTDYTIIERSNIGTGIDFWLGFVVDETEEIVQRGARLEVKGRTRINSDSELRSQVQKAMRQTVLSVSTNMPVYVILTEFSRPVVYMVQS